MGTELKPCGMCGGKTEEKRGPEYWIGRIEDCKYEPDKVFIYLGYLKKAIKQAIEDANRRVPSRTEADDNGCMSSAGFIPPIGTGGKS